MARKVRGGGGKVGKSVAVSEGKLRHSASKKRERIEKGDMWRNVDDGGGMHVYSCSSCCCC